MPRSEQLAKAKGGTQPAMRPKLRRPTKADLEADLRVDASFEEAIDALFRPVKPQRAEERGKAS